MNRYLAALKQCTFFQGRSCEDILALLSAIGGQPRQYGSDEVIVGQGDTAGHLGIVLEGMVEVQRVFPNGETVTMAHLSKGQTFGEAVLFSEQRQYPASVLPASNHCTVLLLPRSDLLQLLQRDETILLRFIETISNRVVMLTNRIEVLSLPSIRQKLLHFLGQECQRQGRLSIELPMTKKQLSAQLGVPRPSLSRELQRMQADGLIQFDRRRIQIRRPEILDGEGFYQ